LGGDRGSEAIKGAENQEERKLQSIAGAKKSWVCSKGKKKECAGGGKISTITTVASGVSPQQDHNH